METLAKAVYKADHERFEAEREKQCEKAGDAYVHREFDPKIIPEVDKDKAYVQSIRLAPPTAKPLYEMAPYPLVQTDFAHCHASSLRGHPSGTLGSLQASGQNGNTIEIGYLRAFDNENSELWTSLLNFGAEV